MIVFGNALNVYAYPDIMCLFLRFLWIVQYYKDLDYVDYIISDDSGLNGSEM